MSDNKDNDVLMSITRNNLDAGLRGIPVGHCTTSKVDPQLGLSYRGYLIKDIVNKEVEEVIYLILYGELPNSQELSNFKTKLISYRKLDVRIYDSLKNFSKDASPMQWFLTGLNVMGMFHSKDNYEEDCLFIIANVTQLVASIFRIKNGWGEPIDSKDDLGYIENFIHMLGLPKSDKVDEKATFDFIKMFEILHFDHGGGNLSTFVGKSVASGLADMYYSLSGAMAALAGPLHGKANQESLLFLKRAMASIKDVSDEKKVNAYLESLWAKKEKIFGFGHAVLRVEDPRATLQYEFGERVASSCELFKLAKTMRKVGANFLKKQAKVSNPYPNVDAVSGVLLNYCGFKNEAYYTVLFGMSRCVGIAAQIIAERTIFRNGKGTPIVRPKFLYSGPVRD